MEIIFDYNYDDVCKHKRRQGYQAAAQLLHLRLMYGPTQVQL